MHFPRLAVPIAACVVATALAAQPAAAGPAPGDEPTQTVALVLRPHDRAALHALAHDTGRRSAASVTALRRALPSAAERRDVVGIARGLGLTVRGGTTMTVHASGPASLVRSLFGSARSTAPASHVQHPLPTLPQPLRGRVTIALGGDDDRPAFRHFALPDGTADGTDFRTAYDDSVLDPLATPTAAEKTATIATVQLSGWHSSDLDTYAEFLRSQSGTGNPAWPTPRYTGIDDVYLPSCITTSDTDDSCDNSPGDDVEVDLDQEAIYATAPYARQRAYLSGNDLVGMLDSLVNIGDDASDPTVDRHIVAASISWGFCETDLNDDPHADDLYATFEDALAYDLATGVTLFAASGDNGGFCDKTKRGVSYPASSPQVIAVGGTDNGTSLANPPHGWVEDATTSSGGGESSVFGRPSYQPAALTGSTKRTVPDIAALAGDPEFDVITTTPSETTRDHPLVGPVFGTSLATPVATATYAVEVAHHGYTWGVGDILPGLYAQPGAFTDVDDGCAAADQTTCPGWNGVDVAGPGYDQVTGLGTPSWSKLVSPTLGGDPHLSVADAYSDTRTVALTVHVPDWQHYDHYRIDVDRSDFGEPSDTRRCTLGGGQSTPPTSVTIDDVGIDGLADGVHDLTLVAWDSTGDSVCHFADALVFVDTTRPKPSAKLSIRGGSRDLVARWHGGDSDGSGVETFTVRLGYPGNTVFSRTTSRRGSVTVAAKRGKVYTLSVEAVDFAGNARTTVARAVDDRQFALRGGWTRPRVSRAFDKSLTSSAHHGPRATVHATGSTYWLYVRTCKSCGKVAVFVDGKPARTIDTYSGSTHNRVPFRVFTAKRSDTRRVVIKPLGRHRSKSNGNNVYLDALTSKG